MTEQLADLTPREAAVMRVLTDKRDTYRASGQREQANTMSEAILLARQVLASAWPDTEPDPPPHLPQFRADDSPAVVAKVIEQLPEPLRTIVRLSRLKTWSIDAIAAEIGLSVAETEQLSGEAGIKLRAILAAAGERRKP